MILGITVFDEARVRRFTFKVFLGIRDEDEENSYVLFFFWDLIIYKMFFYLLFRKVFVNLVG